MPLIPWKHAGKQVLDNLILLNKFQEYLPKECLQNRNKTEGIENGYGTDMEWIQNILLQGICQDAVVQICIIHLLPHPLHPWGIFQILTFVDFDVSL